MVNEIEKKYCTGCKMCGDLCPQKAITYEEDEMGFWYPQIDFSRCNGCNLCEKNCPSLNETYRIQTSEPVVYAAWSKDSHVRKSSTSGGIFWEIAQTFIAQNGVVAGAKYGKDWKSAEHFVARTVEDLELLKGSKYFQSDTAGIYQQVLEELQAGVQVLFCGTPCQNAAMQAFLGKPYDGIYYLDFICRNINSPKAFRAYVEEQEKKFNSRISYVHLKNKRYGWQSLATQLVFEDGTEVIKDKDHDLWVNGFIKHDLFTRESCCSCKYRTIPRSSADITIGDFWGISGENRYDMFQGISVVMVNSDRGREIFEKAKKNLYLAEKTMHDVIPGNPALLRSPEKNKQQQKFFALLGSASFSDAYFNITKERDHKASLFQKIHTIFKEIRKYQKQGEISIPHYIYYNYFCKNVERKGSGKIVPYKNAVIQLHPTSKLVLYGDTDFEIGINKLRKSKAETYVRLERDSLCELRHGGALFFGTMLDLKENSHFSSGYFTANTGTTIVVELSMFFGEDVMIGRNVIVYDSDFHQIVDDDHKQINPPKPVTIEDHVWLTSNIAVLKGVTIGTGSIATAFSQISTDMPSDSIIAGTARAKCVAENSGWSRNRVFKYQEIVQDSRLILYGYGMIGRHFYQNYSDQIDYIIDNHVTGDNIMTFEQFCKEKEDLDENQTWIVASPNYFDEIYSQIKQRYPEAMVIPVTDF